MTGDLQPIAPRDAMELYVDQRAGELSQKTVHNHKYRISRFVEWCEEQEVESMDELTGRDLHEYRVARGEGIKPVTLKNHLTTLQQFLDFCETIDAVPPDMRENVIIPQLTRAEEARDVVLAEERAHEIERHLEQFRYASRDHVVFSLLWHTGIRLGTLRGFDVEDFRPEEKALRVRHRPPQTPLKNGEMAERSVALADRYVELLTDYLNTTREPTSGPGRDPLITTVHGRISESAIRNTVYRLTVPCAIGPCPHDRDPETCEFLEGAHSKCPSSRSPHAIRRGALTRLLRQGTTEQIVGDRCDVSPDVLEQHYDERTEDERREQRRDLIDEL